MDAIYARSDLWIVFGYMAAMMWLAWRVSDQSRDVEGYTVGNRTMGGLTIGLSVLGTFASSITFLGLPAKAYAGDWNAYVFSLALPFAALIAVNYFIPLYRSETTISAYALLEKRFGYWARAYADLSYIILQLIRVATVLLLVALAVRPMLGWEIVPTLIGVGVLVIIYDTLGGIRAVIWTDVVQVIVLMVGALWCLVSLLTDAGGAESVWQSIPAEKFSLGEWSFDLTSSTVFVVFLYGVTENLRNYGTDQSYVQRMLCARSDREASKSIWIGALSYLPLSLMFCLIGAALFAAFPPGASHGLLPDEVFPHFITHQLPKPVAGLVIAAILAAAMSTVDSSLNSMATIFFLDVVQRYRRGNSNVRDIVLLRLSTVTLGTIGTGLAVGMYLLFREESRTIMDIWWQYAGTAGGGMFGLFLLAWLTPYVPSWSAAVGVVLTIPVLAWGTFARNIPLDNDWNWIECPLHPNMVGISATLVMLGVGLAVALLVRGGIIRANPRAQLVDRAP